MCAREVPGATNQEAVAGLSFVGFVLRVVHQEGATPFASALSSFSIVIEQINPRPQRSSSDYGSNDVGRFGTFYSGRLYLRCQRSFKADIHGIPVGS